eukprot:764143-Hanusia_phi.AAC.1
MSPVTMALQIHVSLSTSALLYLPPHGTLSCSVTLPKNASMTAKGKGALRFVLASFNTVWYSDCDLKI